MATLREFMRTICDSSQCIILLSGLIAIAVVCILSSKSGLSVRKNRESKTDSDSCSSPTCLRCSRRGCKKEELLRNLKAFDLVKKTNKGELRRVYKALEGNPTKEISHQKPTVFYLDGLTPQAVWHDSTYTTAELGSLMSSENFQLIKSEFLDLCPDLSDGWLKNSVPTGEWYVFHLYNQGQKVNSNCVKCPRTTEILENIAPFARGCAFGNALFSVLLPGTHIKAHYGPTNCRIRCHLPLVVPEGCILCVEGEQRAWKEGELLLFDDSFLHEAWHRGTTYYRAVLMLDLWHPGLSETEKDAVKFLFSL